VPLQGFGPHNFNSDFMANNISLLIVVFVDLWI